MAAYYVYILECRDGSLYTGIATDVARRVKEHNESPRAAKYTRSRRPVKLRYKARFMSRSNAQKREAAIKRLTRAEKLDLVS